MSPLIIIVAFPLLLGLAHSYGAETVIVDKAFNGREIKVRSDSMIQVSLEQAGATGYTWEIRGPDSEYFEVLSVRTGDRQESGDFVGAPLVKTWLIKANKGGKAKLTFLYYRPWEGEENAVDTFTLSVRIVSSN
ncbi:MAG: protease inhibitor I42 family protein [Nitrospirales bacterium]|nr:protease inhibitor I42 family protein [Nitrospirales bacterium]